MTDNPNVTATAWVLQGDKSHAHVVGARFANRECESHKRHDRHLYKLVHGPLLRTVLRTHFSCIMLNLSWPYPIQRRAPPPGGHLCPALLERCQPYASPSPSISPRGPVPIIQPPRRAECSSRRVPPCCYVLKHFLRFAVRACTQGTGRCTRAVHEANQNTTQLLPEAL